MWCLLWIEEASRPCIYSSCLIQILQNGVGSLALFQQSDETSYMILFPWMQAGPVITTTHHSHDGVTSCGRDKGVLQTSLRPLAIWLGGNPSGDYPGWSWPNQVGPLEEGLEIRDRKCQIEAKQKFSYWCQESRLPCCAEGHTAGESRLPLGAEGLGPIITKDGILPNNQWAWRRTSASDESSPGWQSEFGLLRPRAEDTVKPCPDIWPAETMW